MLRILVLGFVVSAFFGQDNSKLNNYNDTRISYVERDKIDPIIVGHSISNEHKQNWKLNNEKYKECGMCGEEMQAFPGE